jgi:hypothetical protein
MRTGFCLLLQNNILLKILGLSVIKFVLIAVSFFANRISTSKELLPAKIYAEAIYMTLAIVFRLYSNFPDPLHPQSKMSDSIFLKDELLTEAASAAFVTSASCIPDYGMWKV